MSLVETLMPYSVENFLDQAELDRMIAIMDAYKRSVKPNRVNLRAEPNVESSVLAVLAGRTPVFVEGNEAGWALVRTVAGQVGWVREDLLATR